MLTWKRSLSRSNEMTPPPIKMLPLSRRWRPASFKIKREESDDECWVLSVDYDSITADPESSRQSLVRISLRFGTKEKEQEDQSDENIFQNVPTKRKHDAEAFEDEQDPSFNKYKKN
jgi:hypothetical protein